jgi:hypothetical protein
MVRTMRAIDREAKRAQRQRIAYEKAAQKQALLESSAEAAQQYERMIQAIVGTHRLPLARRDWSRIASQPLAAPSASTNYHELAARQALAAYTPNLLHRLFRLEGRRRQSLEQKIEEGRQLDAAEFEKRQRETAARNEEIRFAERVMAMDHGALVDALDEHSKLGDLPFAVEGIDVLFTDDDRVIALVDGLDLDDMPDQSVTLLQSGKASIKALPRSKVLELHRLNICSSAIRVALEFLNALPVPAVEVVMQTDLLDRSTGDVGAEPVLYLRATPEQFADINLLRTEPDALVDRLGGHYTFKKTQGFLPLNLAPFGIPTERTVEA